MSSILDIIGGSILGGLLLLIAITSSHNSIEAFYNYNSDAIVQQNLTQLSRIIEYDLRKMAFGIPEAQQPNVLQIAQSNHLKFIAQLNLDADSFLLIPGVSHYDNIPDTIEYVITPAEEIDFPDTSVTIYEVRRTIKISTGTTHTSIIGRIGNNDVFRYLNQIGDPVQVISATKMVEVTLTAFNPKVVLSPELVSADIYQNIQDVELRKKEVRRLLRASYWRQTRLVSRNLRR